MRRTLKVGQKTFRKMSRYYDLGTKLKAVRLHRSGRGCCTIGRLLGVSASQVQRWLNLYNKGGKKALCSVRKEMDLSAKMECVKMVLEKNLPCEQVFMRYQVGRSTLAKWVRKVRETGDYKALRKDANRKYTTMGRPKKKRLEEMTELERLRYENAYLKAEVDLLKKVKALVEAREQSKRKTGHTSSTN